MEITILEKKQSIIKKIIETNNEELLDSIDHSLNENEHEIPLEIQNRVIATREYCIANPHTLVSEEEIFAYLDEK